MGHSMMATYPAIIHVQQGGTLHPSGHILRLENETVNDTTETIPLTSITIAATAHWDQQQNRTQPC